MAQINYSFLKEFFFIQNILIPGRVLLAPMDGYSDSPFRLLCKKFGAAFCPSEFINAIDILNGHPHLKYKTYFSQIERPFCYQLYDDNPERMLLAASKLLDQKPDLLDVNMGCSARNVSNRGAGAGLLRHPQKIAKIISSLVSTLPIPITAKIRLGWDDTTRNYLEVAHILEDNGVSAITVHARTRRQEYHGIADWKAIAEIKSSVSVPVIGNGDVRSLDDALILAQETNCDGIMIGRAALGNPWIFSGMSRSKVTKEELLSVILQHLDAMVELYGAQLGTMLFRRHLAKYLTEQSFTKKNKVELFSFDSPFALKQYLQNFFERH